MSYEVIENLKKSAEALKEAELERDRLAELLKESEQTVEKAHQALAAAQSDAQELAKALDSVSGLLSSGGSKPPVLEEVVEASPVISEVVEIVEEEPLVVEDTAEKVSEPAVEEQEVVVERVLPVFEGVTERTMKRLVPAIEVILDLDAQDDLPVDLDTVVKLLDGKFNKSQVNGILNKLVSLEWLEREDDLFGFPVNIAESLFDDVDVSDDPFFGGEELDVDEIAL